MTQSQQIAYVAFRFQLWSEGYGSYDKIDADFSAGRLNGRFRAYVEDFTRGTE